MNIDWRGEGVKEVGYDSGDNCIVRVDPHYSRAPQISIYGPIILTSGMVYSFDGKEVLRQVPPCQ